MTLVLLITISFFREEYRIPYMYREPRNYVMQPSAPFDTAGPMYVGVLVYFTILSDPNHEGHHIQPLPEWLKAKRLEIASTNFYVSFTQLCRASKSH